MSIKRNIECLKEWRTPLTISIDGLTAHERYRIARKLKRESDNRKIENK